MSNRISNNTAQSDSATVGNNDAPLTSSPSAVTARYPWQRRVSNALVAAEAGTRPNNSCHFNATTARLSNDTPLITS